MLFLTMLTSLAIANKRIAVLEPRTIGKHESYPLLTAEIDRSRLTLNTLLRNDGYSILTKENMTSILNDMGKDIGSCDASCEVELGRMMGTDYILSSEYLHTTDQIILTLKLYDVTSGNLIDGYQIDNVATWEECRDKHRSSLENLITKELVKTDQITSDPYYNHLLGEIDHLMGSRDLLTIELESQKNINKRLKSQIREQKSLTKRSFMRSTLILGTSLLIPTIATYYIIKLSGDSDTFCDIYKPTNDPRTWSRQCINLNHW